MMREETGGSVPGFLRWGTMEVDKGRPDTLPHVPEDMGV